MTSGDVTAAIARFIADLDAIEPFGGQIKLLSDVWFEIEKKTQHLLTRQEANAIINAQSATVATLRESIKQIKSLKASQYSQAFRALSKMLDEFEQSNLVSKKKLSAYRAQVQNIENRYDDLVNNEYGTGEVYAFIYAAKTLYQLVRADRGTLDFVAESLTPSVSLAEDEDEVEFQFADQFDLTGIAEKLRLLESIYEQIGSSLGYENQRFRVVKIETGSLTLRVAGKAVILWILRPLCFEGAKAIWNRFLPEGRAAAAIEIKMSALQHDADLIDHLKSRGHDIQILEKMHLQKGTVISQQIGMFLSGGGIRIDGVVEAAILELPSPPERPKLPSPDA